jgi:hypothetical protein
MHPHHRFLKFRLKSPELRLLIRSQIEFLNEAVSATFHARATRAPSAHAGLRNRLHHRNDQQESNRHTNKPFHVSLLDFRCCLIRLTSRKREFDTDTWLGV